VEKLAAPENGGIDLVWGGKGSKKKNLHDQQLVVHEENGSSG